MTTVPADMKIHSKPQRVIDGRAKAISSGEGLIGQQLNIWPLGLYC